MSTDPANGNGHGEHGDQALAARRLHRMTPHPYLLARGFSAQAIQQAGWYVEPIGERYKSYGFKDHPDAQHCEAWFIPYRHRNGSVSFERLRLIYDDDIERFGGGKYRGPWRSKAMLYDPNGVCGDDAPYDAVMLVEGEANAVALKQMLPELAVVGLPGQGVFTAAMAADVAHVPALYAWLDRHDPGAEQNARRITEQLAAEGAEEVLHLPPAPGRMDAADMLRSDPGAFAGLIREMIEAAAPLAEQSEAGLGRRELEEMWTLRTKAVTLDHVRLIGHGRDAACEITLSNGEMMVFERLADIATGTNLMAELASCAGVAVALSQADKIRAIAFLRTIAEREEAETANSIAREWGAEFLSTCQQVEVDMADQRERWRCFEHLRALDPWALASDHQGTSPVRHMVVPVDASGLRYIRTGWFLFATRQYDGAVSAAQIISRMMRVGWLRRGNEGRIGAREPKGHGQRNLKFLLAPSGWENLPEELVTGGTTLNAREGSEPRARDIYPTDGYQERVAAVTTPGVANSPPETASGPGATGYQPGGDRR